MSELEVVSSVIVSEDTVVHFIQPNETVVYVLENSETPTVHIVD